jgi:hypothetical protein
MPAYVTGEGEPYRPETLFWMGAEGAVLGHIVGKPGELVSLACESLRSTIERPMLGRPHAPERVRVASPELAEALRAGQSEIEIVCAPTPEIDAVFAAMRERMNEDVETKPSYGDVEVSLRVPREREPSESKPPYDVLAELFELGPDGDEIDAGARRPLEGELVRRFAASPEAKALTDLQACHFVMDFAADYFNATIATLGPRELREIVFDIIPRKVSIDASAASWIIEESRAFYAFLGREFGLEQADACLRVLGGDAVKKLEVALSDTSKFGVAKSLFMGGRKAGFDMESKEGIEAWMRVMQSQPLAASVRLPSLGSGARPIDNAGAQAKKNARKAARKARKKNR